MSSQHLHASLNITSDTINDEENKTLESLQTDYATLLAVIGKILSTEITNATWQTKQLQGGTVGDVQLIYGIANTKSGNKRPYSVVLKTQKKWERHGDKHSWRREYDLYSSDLNTFFSDKFRWPKCYYTQICDNKTQIWMEYVEGISGTDLTVEMFEQVAKELGRFQGKIYVEKPALVKSISNVSDIEYYINEYKRYRSWDQLYNYIRSDDCPLPKHICNMLIKLDKDWESILTQIKKLPIILCHRDFWNANIIQTDEEIRIIDWDTSGWGYMGEDIASLISDEPNINYMVEYYLKCVPAYYEGFSDYVDISSIRYNCIYELILVMFGYRLIEWYKFSESKEEKEVPLKTLEKIYEIGLQAF